MDSNGRSKKSFFLEEISPDENWYVVFEDDGETGYMYIGAVDENGMNGKILDDLWIYNQILPPIRECKEVFILWKEDSSKAAIIVDQECWGMFDLKSRRKINSPRKENLIVTLPHEIWERPLNVNEGVPMKPGIWS